MAPRTLLLLRENQVEQVLESSRLPLRLGSGDGADLRLDGEGIAPEHGVLRLREDGRVELLLAGESRARVLRSGAHLPVGPYQLTVLPGGNSRDEERWLAPVLGLLPKLWNERDPKRLPDLVISTLAEAFGAAWGAFLVPGGEAPATYEVVADTGARPGGERHAASRTVLDKLATTEAPVFQASVVEDPALEGARSIPGAVRSVIASRLRVRREDPVAFLYLESHGAGRPFTAPEASLLQQLTDLAGAELSRAREARVLAAEVERLGEAQRLASQRDEDPSAFLGESDLAKAVDKQLEEAASVSSPVLLLGETGTGKDLAARLIHERSPRRSGPFVAVNGAALPETLAESLLFGHVRGAFSGADQARHGHLRAAHRGTFLLDEVAELDLGVQAKLLRALQERVVEPLGGTEAVPVDVRVVAATHADLAQGIRDRRFREDLYYRLAVLVIELPPLRRRMKDLPALVDHFLAVLNRRHGRSLAIGKPAMAALTRHRWPGNVRELRGVLEQAFVRAEGRWITPESLRFLPGASLGAGAYAGLTLAEAKERLEADVLQALLADLGGDTKEAASRLGIGRSSLYRKCEKFGIDPSSY